jgi:hypothetical protein
MAHTVMASEVEPSFHLYDRSCCRKQKVGGGPPATGFSLSMGWKPEGDPSGAQAKT